MTDSPEQGNRSQKGRIRRFFGGLAQYVQRDQIRTVSEETRRLGSASVESLGYVRDELRSINERISRIEAELAARRGEGE